VDNMLLPSSKPQDKMAERGAPGLSGTTITVVGLHLALVAVGHAGIDSILSLDLLVLYGWGPSKMLIVWAPVVAFYSAGTLLAARLVKEQGLMVTLLVQYACLAGGLGSFPWGLTIDALSHTVPVLQLVIALSSWMMGASIAVTLHTTILTQRLAKWQNVDVQPRIHIGLTLGRCSGPLVTAVVYEWGVAIAPALGANLTFAVSVGVSLMATLGTCGACSSLYVGEMERNKARAIRTRLSVAMGAPPGDLKLMA